MKASFTDLAGLVKASRTSNYHLHHELPYRFYDDVTGVFENKSSRGFGLSLAVLGGANDDLVTSLNAIICNLPEGSKWDYQFVLVGNNQVADLIEQNTHTMAARGGICEQFASNQGIYARHSARQGFSTRLNKAYHYDLKDYNACLFVSTTDTRDALLEAKDMLAAELTQCGLNHSPVSPVELITHVREHLNFNRHQDRPQPATYNGYEPINTQTLSPDSEFLIHRAHMDTRHTPLDTDTPVRTRIVNLGLARLPNDFRLYGFSNCLASLRRTANSLQCPHRISVNFRIEGTGEQITENDSKIQSLTKVVGSKMRLLVPSAEEELEERKDLQHGLMHQEYKIATMVMTVSLYTTQEKARTHTTVATSTFREAGLTVVRTNMLQGQSTLSTLPFAMTEGYFKDCQKAARTRTMKTSNVVNFFPIVAEYKNFSGGVMVPTMRHQISYFDPYNCGSDNYNIALTGGSGAGKSFFTQQLAQAIYARFGKVWILDKGSSYKKLTQTLDGTYMTHENIFLNPFTHLDKMEAARDAGTFGEISDEHGNTVDPIALVLDNITGLIGSMASPREELDSFQSAMLGDAILTAWKSKRTHALIDDVQVALYALAKEKGDDRRISDIAAQLNKYCSDGIYGDVFNKPSQLDPDIHITTLELDGFADAVQRPVVFALMVAINQQMYLSGSRSTPKMCIIEEAWSLMSGANAQAREFINTGYRTARKFGGSFCTVTQGIEDFFQNEEARAAFNNSDIHITLRQGEGFEKFLKDNPKHFSPYEQTMIKNFPRAQDAGHSCAMIKAGSYTSFHRIFADPWSRSMLSTEPKEYEYCENLINRGVPILEAIEQTAMHFNGPAMEEFAAILAQYQTDKEKIA
ncbi:type IV secretion system protein TraC [Pseudomonadota bacterium]